MQKKEQEVCVSLQGKHSWDNIFVTKKKCFSGMRTKKLFLTRKFLVKWQQTNIFLIWPKLKFFIALLSFGFRKIA